MDEEQLGNMFSNECSSSFTKFVSRAFNQVDRLLSLEQHSK